MAESHMTYDLIPNVDKQAYTAWAKKAIGTLLQQPGVIEFRAYRNWSGNPQVLTVTVWETAADWAKFGECVWPELNEELYTFATNIHYILWEASPVVPQPLHPTR